MKLFRVNRQSSEPRTAGSGRWFTDSFRDLWNYAKPNGFSEPIVEVEVDDPERFRVSNLPAWHEARRFSARPECEFYIYDDDVLRRAKEWWKPCR